MDKVIKYRALPSSEFTKWGKESLYPLSIPEYIGYVSYVHRDILMTVYALLGYNLNYINNSLIVINEPIKQTLESLGFKVIAAGWEEKL